VKIPSVDPVPVPDIPEPYEYGALPEGLMVLDFDGNELDDGTFTIPLDRPEPYVGNGRVRVDFEWVVENLLEGLPVPTPEPCECPGAVPDGMIVKLEKWPLDEGTLVTPPIEPTVDGP
jgi:hypothetical protein